MNRMSDSISRQAAIDFIDAGHLVDGNEPRWSDYEVVNFLKSRPSAQPEQQWIPCSERLPEDLEEVNVTWINTDPEPYYDFIKGKPFTGTAVYYKGRWFWYSAVCTDYLREYGFSHNDLMDDGIKVIAWMPLPEPYKGEQE